ncbi:GspH/FimT family pseudopilin [Lysobacter enzymogenes]|uniref:GspH/FimT family pseudopilin n=1 Tax=Lysobacter enzymogenes TaxID=69 RepID=UPI001A978244|nr:GspH/FimT family pseudopilin [Lysobacter enzymogenes]QQP98831.1 GspH/FimT family pseudopilin [Lysobacter enzymogenes]
MARRSSAGFTLIELLVTLGIGAILLALALPSFTEAIRSNRVSGAANQLMATVNFARAEALRSKSTAHICPKQPSAELCGNNWANGMLVWTDENGNGTIQEASEVKRVIEPQDGIVMDFGSLTEMVFNDRGGTDRRAVYNFNLQASVCKPNAQTRRVFSVNAIGRVIMTRETCQ